MARRVFFSFHYERDIWCASQIRNSWVIKPDRETADFSDVDSWEEVKKKGEKEVKRWIDNQLNGTSVIVFFPLFIGPMIGFTIMDTRIWVIG